MQKFIIACVLMFSSLGFAAAGTPDVSCECQDSSCGPCEAEVGTSFYSAKCGASGERVKSCKKPTCEPVADQKQCLADLAISKASTAAAPTAPKKDDTGSLASGQKRARAGAIEELAGDVKIAFNGRSDYAHKDDVVYVGDSLETSAGGKARIKLDDGSKLMLASNSKVQIDKIDTDLAAKRRRIAMSLLSGKVRNKVEKKFEGENIFEVKTRTAVAGVRGTDFVTSFETEGDKLVTKVETIEGQVRLADVSQSEFLDDKEASPVGERMVEAGNGASLIVSAPKSDDEADLKRAIHEGVITPTFKIKPEEIESLKEATEFAAIKTAKAPEREVASVSNDTVCDAPAGLFNQCSFTCEGNNPKHETKCRTDLPDVSCVRRICRANGKWNEAARLPASGGSLCDPKKTVVRECGSYW